MSLISFLSLLNIDKAVALNQKHVSFKDILFTQMPSTFSLNGVHDCMKKPSNVLSMLSGYSLNKKE